MIKSDVAGIISNALKLFVDNGQISHSQRFVLLRLLDDCLYSESRRIGCDTLDTVKKIYPDAFSESRGCQSDVA